VFAAAPVAKVANFEWALEVNVEVLEWVEAEGEDEESAKTGDW